MKKAILQDMGIRRRRCGDHRNDGAWERFRRDAAKHSIQVRDTTAGGRLLCADRPRCVVGEEWWRGSVGGGRRDVAEHLF